MTIRTAVEATALKSLLGLPAPVLRRLAGPPVVVDGQTLSVETQLTLRLQRLARIPGSETLPVPQGRDAMLHATEVVRGSQPIGAVRDLEVAGMPARHYLPTSLATGRNGVRAGEPGGLLLYFHGGGFLYGALDTHDGPCRVLAERSGVPVLAIDYRLAPEHAFPACFDDAEAALTWVIAHADELGVDPTRIGVGGDSAGGNIAAWLAIRAARSDVPLAWQGLVYPCTDPRRDTESYRLFGEDFYLTRDYIERVNDIFLPTDEDRDDERVRLLAAELPAGLAPAYVVTAGFDPLRDEGEAYARRLADAGVPVDLQRFDDQIHGFLNIVGVGRSSRAAVDVVADRLKDALG